MRKLLLCLAAVVLSSCGDDLGWDQKVNTDAKDCYDANEPVDSGVCNLCQDATETDVQSDTTTTPEDVTVTDSSDSVSDVGDNDTGDTGDDSDIPDTPGDATETDIDIVPPPECVTATDCVTVALPCLAPGCEAGKCVTVLANTPCSDDNECTVGDQCQLGTCVAGIQPNCDDLNPCTDDSCDPLKGCVHLPNQATCTDDDACTGGDTCFEGACKGDPVNCGDVNPCTDDSCDKLAGCVNLPNAVTCVDGNGCTTDDVCKDKVCTPGPALVCDDQNPCTSDSCESFPDEIHVCTFASNDLPCDDGDLCTLNDKCGGSKCISGALVECLGTSCIVSSCVAGKCEDDLKTLNDVECDDGNVCTALSKCLDGKCLTLNNKDCNDGNSCTADSCSKDSGCANSPLNAVDCDDGNVCTQVDTCESGTCKPGLPKVCSDDNPCTLDVCEPVAGCKFTNQPDGSLCGDGLCSAGKCTCTLGFGCAAPKFTYSNDTDAGMLGGMGGGVGPKMGCAETDILIGIGFDFSVGTKTATRTTVVCGTVNAAPDGTVTTTKTTTEKSGGSGCFGWDPSVETPLVECDSGWGVVGIKGKKPGGTLFNSVSLVCGKLNVNGKPTGETKELNVPGMPGNGDDQSISCPEGSIARFFETRAGCGQDALTMYCATPAPDCTGQPLICKDIQ